MVCLKCRSDSDRGTAGYCSDETTPPFDRRDTCRSVRFPKVRRTGKMGELMVANGLLFQKRAEGCRSWAGLGINDDIVREAGRVVCRRALDQEAG